MTKASNERRFVDEANPHQWLMVADNLHVQAIATWNRFRGGKTSHVDASGHLVGEWDEANRTVFLLSGFAIENALKAYLVFENPSWISNGRLSRELRSHQLVKLSRLSALVPTSPIFVEVLERFEAGLESWARYPCALTADESEPEAVLNADDWHRYTRLMQSYGRRLCELLSANIWKGPHGFAGRWTFQGEYLGAKVSCLSAIASGENASL